MVKCECCKKKINLAEQVASMCKCKNMFCLMHRLPEFHACTHIDKIKDADKKVLEKNLVKVEGDKMIKI